MDNPRCLVIFLESCRSERTKKDYLFKLDKFLKWAEKDYESVLFLSKPELTDLLVDYALYLKKRVSPNSIAMYFAGVFKFLDMNDKEYNKRKIHFLFGEKVERGGDRAITNKELNQMLRACSTHKDRAMLQVFSAVGCRPQAISDLKLKDVDAIGDDCLSLRIYAGSTHARFTFLHGIASDSLRKYHKWRESQGEKLTSDSWVFVGNRKFASMPTEPLSPTTIAKIFVLLMKKAGITRVKTGNRFDLASCGGFRKRFNTILKMNPNISQAIAERLMDHKDGLEDNYLKPTREELFEEYKKAIPELIFDESEKLKIKLENKQKKIDELESSKDRITELESRMASIDELVKRIKSP